MFEQMERESMNGLDAILININSDVYQALLPYIEKGKTIAVAQRGLPSDQEIEYSENIGNGRYYAIGSINQYGKLWEQLDAKLIQFVSNQEIESRLEEKVKHKTRMTLEEFLSKKNMNIEKLAKLEKLPYIPEKKKGALSVLQSAVQF